MPKGNKGKVLAVTVEEEEEGTSKRRYGRIINNQENKK
jgi:hypothetical protein